MRNDIKNCSQLGSRVRELRKAQGLSQEDLCGMTGTGRRFISDLEQGKETVQFGLVLEVLATLGVSLQTVSRWYQGEEVS